MDAETRRRQLAAAIARVAAGDRAALRLVYAATSAKLFGVCLRILGDRSEAEDVVQEVYLTVWRKAARFDDSVGEPDHLAGGHRAQPLHRPLAPGALSAGELADEAVDNVPDAAPSAVERLESGEDQAQLKALPRGA